MDCKEIKAVLVGAARGCYQRDVLAGEARLSGADLRGKARRWSCRYKDSRESAVRRGGAAVAAHGWQLEEARGARGLRYLVLVSPTGERVEV